MQGLTLSLLACLCVSVNYITGKFGVTGFGADSFSLVWITAATVYTLAAVLATGRAGQLRLPREVWSRVLAMGILTGLQMILFWWSLDLLDAPFAAFLGRFEPALTILLAGLLLGERLRLREGLAIGVMIAGGCLSTAGVWQEVGLGVLLVILACLTMSLQFVLGKNLAGKVHPGIMVFYRAACASAMMFLWVAGPGEARFDVAPFYWGVTLVGAFLGPFVGYTLLFHSYRYWDLTRTSIVMTLQPLFVLPLGLIFLPEQGLSPQQLLGGLLILAGALWLIAIHRGHRNAGRRVPVAVSED